MRKNWEGSRRYKYKVAVVSLLKGVVCSEGQFCIKVIAVIPGSKVCVATTFRDYIESAATFMCAFQFGLEPCPIATKTGYQLLKILLSFVSNPASIIYIPTGGMGYGRVISGEELVAYRGDAHSFEAFHASFIAGVDLLPGVHD